MLEFKNGFRKSKRSQVNNCVEVATNDIADTGVVGVRDSKDVNGPVLAFGSAQWSTFVSGISRLA